MTEQQSSQTDPSRQDDEIDLLELWQLLVDHKKLIATITGVTTAVALIASLLMTPIYRAEVLLAPVSQEQTGGMGALASQYGDFASLAGISLGGGGDSQTQRALATLKARALTEIFMKEEGVLPVLFPGIWDEERKVWKKSWGQSGDKPPGPSMEGAFRQFNGSIRSVQSDKKTSLITLAIEWEDPTLTAKWANALVKRANAQLQKEAIADAEKSIAFLQKQLAKTGTMEVQQAIYRLIEAQTKNVMVANTREEFAFKVIDPATLPERKVRPKRALIVLFGLMVGFMVGVTTAFVLARIATRRTAGKRVDV